jgi:hypothetical protein
MKRLIVTTLCAGVLSIAVWGQNVASSSAGSQQTSAALGEKKLKGCLVSVGGKYVLQERRGKETLLAGSPELGTQVGHTVTAHGIFTSNDQRVAGKARQAFVVSRLEMNSDTCGADKNKLAEQTFDSDGKPSPSHKH